ncbi:MAG: UDP-N-acetylmuramoyl-L-alanyl-D-glutamate--2,6-diaminopimelate ligase, partial [Clostridia bacterium]|nr:UDP-N-acetylmuramoyl-L-alanyl-D-glutamate--2,6-diaminopimelate ligase [Clostridia bacterium]
GDCNIEDLSMDSRRKTGNALFFCISGARFDSHRFAAQAVENGACALAVERYLDIDVPQVLVHNGRKAMTRMSAAFFGDPAKKLRMIGITGTKGKTTTSYLVKAVMEAAGLKCGLIGTTGNMIGSRYLKSEFTTPEPIDLHRTLRQMVDEGVQCVSMEVSAHALAMGRLEGVQFETGCYTNLSQDHLDLFGTMDAYFACKKSFFDPKWIRNASVNTDDERAGAILNGLKVPHMTYGIAKNADLYARDIEITENGVSFVATLSGLREMHVRLHLTGMFNVYNALAAASIGLIAGLPMDVITAGLESVMAVPGRAEMLETGTPYKVILDYSHSPDALENILTTVREFTRGRVICVFGCGGDRDKLKRPIMGEISGRLSDVSILTSDNPRSEDPYQILSDIEEGIQKSGGKYIKIENRREAIRKALSIAGDGDLIVLAGKGHETYQEIRGV